MSAITSFEWTSLPHEMKLAVLDNLPLPDVQACSRANRDSYNACLPTLFHTVRLPSLEALLSFLKAVPSHRYSLIHDLSVSTKSHLNDYHDYDAFTRPASHDTNDALATLLSDCTSLESLSISVCGSLASGIILPIFQKLERVKKLRLENLEQEEVEPLSERLAVALAFSLPLLEELSLTRITRSSLHAPELHCSNVPIVVGDDDIPSHPVLGPEYRLPALLRLPRLKHLRIRDTHLGDPQWAGPSPDETGEQDEKCCPLEVLDLGSCAHISPAANEMHTARILARAPSSITSCALSASLPSPTTSSPLSPLCKSKPSSTASASASASSSYAPTSPVPESCIPPLPRLRTLHLTPLVPTAALGSTLAQPALAGSPVHTLSCAFHPDDAAEGCAALEAFLRERAARATTPVIALPQPRTAGRKRAGSKLRMCTEPESFTEGDVSDASSSVRARANTAPVVPPSPTTSTPAINQAQVQIPLTPSRLYPSLSTLAIDIPEELSEQSLSPGTKLSPRRLAAARRRAEERRTAAFRLQALAQELGLEVILHGVDIGSDSSSSASFGLSKSVGDKVVRARANSAF